MSSPVVQPFCFVLPVWGTAYVNFFLKYSLPSQLANGNLNALHNARNVYCIYTRACDKEIIEAANIYSQLQTVIKIKITIIDEQIKNIHLRASDCFRQGINHARTINAAIIFLVPDGLYSAGSFNYLQQQLAQGYRGILVASPTFDSVKGAELLDKMVNTQGVIEASGRDYIDLVLQAMHVNTKEQFYEEESGNLMPGSMYWHVNGKGLFSHSFHLHPMMIAPTNWEYEFAGTVDGDYVCGACPNPEDILIVQDSDDFCMTEIAIQTHVIYACYKKGNPDDVIDWAIIHANEQHVQAFLVPIRLKSNKFTAYDQEWLDVETRASKVVEHVRKNFGTGTWSLSKLFKFRYAYFRKFMFNLRYTERLQRQGLNYWLIKTIVSTHSVYVLIAARFLKLQAASKQRLFTNDAKYTGSWFNLYYWASTLSANTLPSKLVNYISFCMPLLTKWNLRGKSPMLMQMFMYPLVFPLVAMGILVLNFTIGMQLRLSKRAV